MSETIKIMIVDDHPIVREGLSLILGTQNDFEVIEEASNGQEAIEKLENINPDIILLDLEMPVLDGIETIKKLMVKDNSIKILVLTVFDTDDRIISAIQSGARGYLIKDSPRDKIFNAIRIIYQGGTLFSPLDVSKVLNQNNKSVEILTERELEVLKLMAEGMANKNISSKLFITERTVKFHVSSILTKLNASNRTEAVTIAVHKGLIEI